MSDWTLQPEEDGLTALALLRRRLPAASSAYLRGLLRKGRVRRGSEPLAEEAVVRAGDRLVLPGSRRLGELLAGPGGLEILLESRDLLAVHKPAGLAVHRGVGHEADNLTLRVQALMKQRQAPFAIAPVHRLDAETSGPVLFGKGRRAIAHLGKLFMTQQVEKVYLTLAAGTMPAEGVLATPVPAKGRLKAATTFYRVLAAGGGCSLLELHLQTGRTHQIRRQLADAGHPVAGDRRYGGRSPVGLERLFLHCCRLVLPAAAGPLVVSAPLPGELAAVLVGLGMSLPSPPATSST